MINKVILMGRLVADPELKRTANDVAVVSTRIAVDRDFKSANGERQADFIDIVCWRERAEFVSRYFRKGNMIAVVGSLQSRQYETKDGQKRTVIEVVCDQVSFTGEKANNGGGFAPRQDAPAPEFTAPGGDDFEEVDDDSQLPF
ncbi:MAG: single-stranded DNA-binding protein [Clostridia bacterium]|nr:single-stranded DNA-binding protein [Clostridia bacterium]MBR5768609.1 single-stranded DNA-binding protein [Clostridia bacterium]MBR5941783.1 single-stranded DNA-binding protein [Clostridia bacterium]